MTSRAEILLNLKISTANFSCSLIATALKFQLPVKNNFFTGSQNSRAVAINPKSLSELEMLSFNKISALENK